MESPAALLGPLLEGYPRPDLPSCIDSRSVSDLRLEAFDLCEGRLETLAVDEARRSLRVNLCLSLSPSVEWTLGALLLLPLPKNDAPPMGVEGTDVFVDLGLLDGFDGGVGSAPRLGMMSFPPAVPDDMLGALEGGCVGGCDDDGAALQSLVVPSSEDGEDGGELRVGDDGC